MAVELELVQIENPDELNLIFGQSHFIKTVEDVYEALIQSCPGIKFGIAFCEASGPCLIRSDGNDQPLIELAVRNAEKVAAGHAFMIFLKDAFPINVIPGLRNVPELVTLFTATANPLQIVIAKTGQGRGVLGVIDGGASKGVETDQDKDERMLLLRRFGYKRH
jgi:adenosine/AMP kinase